MSASGDMGALAAYGSKTAVRSEAAILADNAPQLMRELLAPDAPEFCRLLVADMRDRDCKGHRTAMTLYAQILKAIGDGPSLVLHLWTQLGVSGMDEAAAAVQQVREAPRDPALIAKSCRDYLAWYDGPSGPGRSIERAEVAE